MINKPDKCCEVGTYGHTIPMPIQGRSCGIDFCVADVVAALNAANITTEASCCGHGKRHGCIHLSDGRVLIIVTPNVIGTEEDWEDMTEIRKEKKG